MKFLGYNKGFGIIPFRTVFFTSCISYYSNNNKRTTGNCLIPANFKFSWCISFVNLWENLFLREIYLEGPNNLNTTCHYLISLNYVKTTVKGTFFKISTCLSYMRKISLRELTTSVYGIRNVRVYCGKNYFAPLLDFLVHPLFCHCFPWADSFNSYVQCTFNDTSCLCMWMCMHLD